ncbi:putative RNA-directed DNA polymerase from transposon BS [Trichonephila clavipes]|nr:putative RNA-directed DNA polymerase from transposon BS [Trichonephila clavipes]
MDIEQISFNTRFLLVSLPHNDMSIKSPFAIQKALIGIVGELKSVKRLRFGNLLIETTSALQTKSFLLAKSFLNSPVTVSPHKSLNSCRGVISEPDLLTTSESEILEGFSDQAGYLHCKIRPYIPNPLRCFKCQRFGHSQTACRGQLTSSRCASVGHASSDCSLELKCVNCSQPHSADSKLCPKWKIEKEIQTIKTNRNVSYIEARKFITPQPSQTYAQVVKSVTVNSSSQTDETNTKIVCPPLKLLQPLIPISKPIMSPSVPAVIKYSTSTQAELIPSTSSVTVASPSKSPPPTSVIDTVTTTSNSLSISVASSSSTACSVLETTTTTSTVSPENLPVSVHNDSNSDHSNAAEAQQFVKRKSRNRRKRPKVQKPDIEIKGFHINLGMQHLQK